ncbi:MAG: CspA family cold shock protein [Alcanivorax sp.]|jgi:CspA family cold shock protein
MTLLGKLVTSLIVAAVASTITTKLMDGQLADLTLHIAFAAATIATALLTSLTRSTAVSRNRSASSNSSSGSKSKSKSSANPARTEKSGDADREEGEVKWFNVSKGFGFITKDDGEEIFVHFRSIRGDGRRSLKDGQRVSFHVADSDKGPQAEDVEGH